MAKFNYPAPGYAKLDETIKILDSLLAHRKAHPKQKSDELYYQLVGKYFKRIRTARDDGKLVIAHSPLLSQPIIYTLDMVPLNDEPIPLIMCQLLNFYKETYGAASVFGFPSELCAVHRNLIGSCMLGYFPPIDAIAHMSMGCDNHMKTPRTMARLFDIPEFIIDRPWEQTDTTVQYFSRELEDFANSLASLGGTKMDLDILKEKVRVSVRHYDLFQAITELKKAVPCPISHLKLQQLHLIDMLYFGEPEGIEFFETVYDEGKRRMEQKIGAANPENYRLMTLFWPPTYSSDLMHWLEGTVGAISVASPFDSRYENEEVDPEKPYEALAKIAYYRPFCRMFQGPINKELIKKMAKSAVEYKVDGAIFYAHIGCRQFCQLIKIVKDVLTEEAGIPMLTLDMDYIDPSYVSEDTLKENILDFVETLEK